MSNPKREKKFGNFVKKSTFTVQDNLVKTFDTLVITPTTKVTDFIGGTTKKVLNCGKYSKFEDEEVKSKRMDTAFKKRVQDAKAAGGRLRNVFAAPLANMDPRDIAVYKPPQFKKTPEEKEFLTEVCNKSFIFQHLAPKEKQHFVDAFEQYDVKQGTRIITQGDVGDYFYVISSGTIEYIVDDQPVGEGHAGEQFGGLALLYNCPRAATCVAKTDGKLWRIHQEVFRRIIAKYQVEKDTDTKTLLSKIPFLENIDDKDLTKIATLLRSKKFDKGDVIVRKGDDAEFWYIIQSGSVLASDIVVNDTKIDDVVLPAGTCFNEQPLMKNQKVYGTATALEPTTCLCLPKHLFVRMFGRMRSLIQLSADIKALKVLAFKGLVSDEEYKAMGRVIKNLKFPKGHVFFVEGKASASGLCFIRSGKVSLKSSSKSSIAKFEEMTGFSMESNHGEDEDYYKVISPGGYFGIETIEHDKDGNVGASKFTVTALEDCVVGILGAKAIVSVLGTAVRNKNYIRFDDLEMYRILGAGTFGKVWLVSRKTDKTQAYALKVQKKRALIDMNQVEGVMQEKKIMAKLDSDFILKLAGSYQDPDHVYMLMNLYQGGELGSIMHTDTRDDLPEWAARFYAGSVLEGLSYMHQHHVIYRDLKPENVLLDSKGYTVIIDLGFAKIIKDKTYTFCGTPLYIAPEIVLQRGHDHTADIWSWGVMLYEMLVGKTPFYESGMDQMALFRRLCEGKFEFPPGDWMSDESKDLVDSALMVNPSYRIGAFDPWAIDMKTHEWYAGFDWDALHNRTMEAPWKPDITDPLDSSNFGEWKKMESKRDLKDEVPLSAAEQEYFKGF
eukprot:CAMPEP_0195285806 /NCGR_PEP_ID=MMETSP0707-20130614/3509_1 /TAXON_ID=33640 /ORGANISM="Asterionellopsis glacialis, Strain CCMP134" /LENGTH=835 /DNA_ID=CAMNT_0040345359 /DNA_START=89 /DNA_END=2596 /DNA_ORIENTATION=-